MKAIVVIILGLLLSGCADSSGSRLFGPTPIDVGRIIESNEHFIKIITDRSVVGDGTNYVKKDAPLTIPQKKAKAHCAKYEKYAHFFAWDFDKEGSYYRCYKIPQNTNDAGNMARWSSYPEQPWGVASEETEPIKTVEAAIDYFFKNRKSLEPIEGIWYDAETTMPMRGTYAIYKVGEGLYSRWIIENSISRLSGTHDGPSSGSIRVSVSDKIYSVKSTWVRNHKDPSRDEISHGKL